MRLPLDRAAYIFPIKPSTRIVAVPVVLAALFTCVAGGAQAQDFGLFVSNFGDNTIRKVDASGNVTTFATGLNGPSGMALSGNGDLYVANYGPTGNGASISRISPAGTISTFVSGAAFQGIQGITFGPSGDLFAASDVTNSILRITPSGTATAFASGLNTPQGIAFDATGNMFVSSFAGSLIYRITPSGSVSLFTGVGLSNPRSLAFDSAGLLYATNYGSNSISRITTSGLVTTFSSAGSLSGPTGIGQDVAGNLFVANISGDSISRLQSNGTNSVFAIGNGLFVPNYVVVTGSISAPEGSTLGLVLPIMLLALVSSHTRSIGSRRH